MAGVINSATNSSDTTTITGIDRATTISGASTALKPPPPTESSHWSTVDSTAQPSSVSRTCASAGSQKK